MRLKRLLSIFGAVLLLSAAPICLSAKKMSQNSSRKTPASGANARVPSPEKIKAKSGKRKSRRRQRGQKAPTPERIREIQSALAREGAYRKDPNGKWDAASVEAMKRFQAAHGLDPTGKLGALSLQKLGLGSEVAGRAAPRPPAQPLLAPGVHPQ